MRLIGTVLYAGLGRDSRWRAGVSGIAIGGLHPVIFVGLVQHLDVAQHLDPIGGVPAGHDQPQRKAVQQRQRLCRSSR